MTDLKFFIDFDGTITTEDVIDKILDRFADPAWRVIEEEWASGKIGSRQCLARQMALVRATPPKFDALLNEVQVDPHFTEFLLYAKTADIPVVIVSDGFDIVIGSVLKRALEKLPEIASSLTVHSNRLRWGTKGLETKFSEEVCEHGCANCKEKIIRENAASGERVFFIGDGLSDRHAARCADLTFAKGKLLDFCRENKITHEPYQSFKDIEHWLAKQKGKQWALQRTNS